MNDELWKDKASCKGAPDFFFDPDNEHDTGRALKFCAGCNVREACLEYGMVHKEYLPGREGIWGGLTPKQLRALQRARVKARKDKGTK